MMRSSAGIDLWKELEEHFQHKDLEDWVAEVDRCSSSGVDLSGLASSAKTLFDAHYGISNERHQNLALGYGLLAGALFFRSGKIAQGFSVMTRLGSCEGSDPIRRYLSDLFESLGFIETAEKPKNREHRPGLHEAQTILEDVQAQHLLERPTDLQFLAKHLGPGGILRLIQASKVRRIYEGERLYFKNDVSRYLYVLVDGKVSLVTEQAKGLNLPEGSVFGEVSLFLGKRKHSCEALVTKDGEVLELSVEALADLFVEEPQLETNFRSLLFWRLFENFSRGRIEFRGVEARILEEFFYSCDLETAHHDEVLAVDPKRRLIIILAGHFQTRDLSSASAHWVDQEAPELVWLDRVEVRTVDHLLYMVINDLALGAEWEDFEFIRKHFKKD